MLKKLSVFLYLSIISPSLADESFHVINLTNTGNQEIFDAILPLYADMIEMTKKDSIFSDADIRALFYIDTYDLNGDKTPEIFVHLISHDSCGSLGCSFDILQKKSGGQWQNIGAMTLDPGTLGISWHTTEQYHDVYVMDSAKEAPVGILRWNGNKYDY